MPTYEDADDDARNLMDELIENYRQDLRRAEAEITLLFAYGERKSGALVTPALKRRGKRLLGKCKVHSVEDRAIGAKDATIVLDGDRFPGLPEAERKAVLHHELLHIDGWNGERDSDGRPRLKGREGDWDFDGFDEILETYGEASIEHKNLATIAERHAQLKLPFGDVAAEAAAEWESAAPPKRKASRSRSRKPKEVQA